MAYPVYRFNCVDGSAFEFMILLYLRAFPEPVSVLVMDNCQIYHKHEVPMIAMAESACARIIFLAPCSPIDNPMLAFDVFKT